MHTDRNIWKVNLYNKKHAFVYQYGEELIGILDPKPDELILDLGCGSGQLTDGIAKTGAKVIGMDNSEEMIQYARNEYPELQFFVKDATNFQFNKPFDAIFSNAVLHWVTDNKSAVLSMYNNLKKEGRLVVEFGGKGNVETIINGIKKALTDKGYLQKSKIEKWFFPSISEYTGLLEENGFEVQYAHLFDRPTELADHKIGLKEWIEMFGASFFIDIPEKDKNKILEEVQKNVWDKCFKDGKWFADYRRIRIIAKKIN